MKISMITMSGIKNVFTKRPSNAILLFITGFFFTQFMLVNVLYAKHPLGGWVTSLGTFSTSIILFVTYLTLALCLFTFLWRSVNKDRKPQESVQLKTSMVKVQNVFSPIDYPKSTTQPVVSGYSLG